MSAKRKEKRPNKKHRTGLLLTFGSAVIILLIIAVGWFLFQNQAASAGEQATGANVAVTTSGPPAPDFSVPTLSGDTFTLSDQRGKPVIVFIMAYWCGTCIPEAQALAELHQKYGDQVEILALDVDPSSSPEALQSFRARVGNPEYTWAFDEGNRVAEAYEVRALDSTFIINQAGEIVYSDSHPTSYKTLEQELATVLG